MNPNSNVDWSQLVQRQGPQTMGHDDDGVIGIFKTQSVPDKERSVIEGRPCFKDETVVEIRVPGQPKSVPTVRVTDEYKKRWPKAWADFEAQKPGMVDGTPLEQWIYLTPSEVMTLRARGVYSVEQCANLTDGALAGVGMKAREWRERAKQFLAGPSASERELREKIAEQDRLMAEMRAEINLLRQRPLHDAPTPAPDGTQTISNRIPAYGLEAMLQEVQPRESIEPIPDYQPPVESLDDKIAAAVARALAAMSKPRAKRRTRRPRKAAA